MSFDSRSLTNRSGWFVIEKVVTSVVNNLYDVSSRGNLVPGRHLNKKVHHWSSESVESNIDYKKSI